LVEHSPEEGRVTGSTPVPSTIESTIKPLMAVLLLLG
jgi:hypothetical protein